MSETGLLTRMAKEEAKKRRRRLTPPMVQITVRVPVQMHRLLTNYCQRRGLSAGEVIRRALDLYFDHEREKGRL